MFSATATTTAATTTTTTTATTTTTQQQQNNNNKTGSHGQREAVKWALQAVATTNAEVRGFHAWQTLSWKACFHYNDGSNLAEEIWFLEFSVNLI